KAVSESLENPKQDVLNWKFRHERFYPDYYLENSTTGDLKLLSDAHLFCEKRFMKFIHGRRFKYHFVVCPNTIQIVKMIILDNLCTDQADQLKLCLDFPEELIAEIMDYIMSNLEDQIDKRYDF